MKPARVLAWMLVLAMLCPALANTIEGTVTLRSPLKKRATGRRTRAGYGKVAGGYETQEQAAQGDEARNVVIYLVGLKGKGEGKFPAPRMEQKGRQFLPFVLPVLVGTTVEFPNQDIIYHGVYSDSTAKKFELPEYPKGESRSVTFDKAGVVELFCAIHTHMNAYIVVLDNGFFAMPDEQHHFRITGVPPGRYVLKAWHPRLEGLSQVVEVKGDKAQVDLTL